jgi:hypothetical protein
MSAPNVLYGRLQQAELRSSFGVQIGGSARAYQEFPAPLAIPASAEQAAARPVCLCIVSAGRDRSLMPHLRREAPCCIPGSAGRDSKGGSWV